MSHTLEMQGEYVSQHRYNGTVYAKLTDDKNPNVTVLIPYDRRYYKGLKVTVKGQIVEVGYKLLRVLPHSVSFMED